MYCIIRIVCIILLVLCRNTSILDATSLLTYYLPGAWPDRSWVARAALVAQDRSGSLVMARDGSGWLGMAQDGSGWLGAWCWGKAGHEARSGSRTYSLV